jgi:hypothetical protein
MEPNVKAGTYFIGDLCGVLPEAMDVDMIGGERCLDDGTEFAIYFTHLGDGIYPDQEGNLYTVDSGTLGCVRLDTDAMRKTAEDSIERWGDGRSGRIVTFAEDFKTRCTPKTSTIVFGDIRIWTKMF